MAKICPLCSGSGGNSTYISTSDGDILIDAGASAKALCEGIDAVGGSISRIKAIAITHTHTDHIRGLKTFLKKCDAPLVASSKTLEQLGALDVIPCGTKVINIDSTDAVFGDIAIRFFSTSHDSEGSGGYVITLPDTRRIAVCTDLGKFDDVVCDALSGCTAVLLESNHDIQMLKNGPYPPALKLRIMSEVGHLSNNACANELPTLLKSGATRFILGHLSMHNNMPALALSAARATLADAGAVVGEDCLITVAKPKLSEVTVL